MLEDLNKVIAVLQYLKLKPDIGVYEWRFLMQKIASLSKDLGIPIGYVFTIYVKGPYSPELACDYYRNVDAVTSLKTDYKLSPNDINVVKRVKGIVLSEPRGVDDVRLQGVQFLESVSTAVHLMAPASLVREDEVFSKMKELKPYLSDYLVVVGINKAKELLFKAEYLTHELAKEIYEWERIDG